MTINWLGVCLYTAVLIVAGVLLSFIGVGGFGAFGTGMLIGVFWLLFAPHKYQPLRSDLE